MRSARKVLVIGLIINLLASTALLLTGRDANLFSALAGGLLPLFLSTLLIGIGERSRGRQAQYFQTINIIGFGVKMLLIGGWSVLVLTMEHSHKVTFIVFLLVNFLAWHMVEAYHWRLFMRSEESKEGESTQ